MRIAVEAWSPEYGGEVDLGLPEDLTTENVDVACETDRWAPIVPDGAGDTAAPVAFIDGTRRLDARVFVTGDNGDAPVMGVAGSVGVGSVICHWAPWASNGHRRRSRWAAGPAEVRELRIERFLAVGAGVDAALSCGAGLEYQSLPVPTSSYDGLVAAVHNQMRAREAMLALELADSGLLAFVDGTLALQSPGPQRVLGFIKAHHKRYLQAEEESLLGRLSCGERTPLFAFGEQRPRYSFYLRLCKLDRGAHSWHGIVRCEIPAQVGVDAAVELADTAAHVLPSFASLPYWDARAPQNLVPVAGLEKRLRHLLGDRELVYRMIRSAAAKASSAEALAP